MRVLILRQCEIGEITLVNQKHTAEIWLPDTLRIFYQPGFPAHIVFEDSKGHQTKIIPHNIIKAEIV